MKNQIQSMKNQIMKTTNRSSSVDKVNSSFIKRKYMIAISLLLKLDDCDSLSLLPYSQ